MAPRPSCSDNVPRDAAGCQHEPIAIIGMGCRLPGQASTPSKLWDLLIENKSAHSQVPPQRYNVEGYYHPHGERPGSIHSTGGYFIQEDIHAFDNAFFNIHNLEATYMDAQQKKLLEVVYEAFENANVRLDHIQGSKTGVYVGNFTYDHMVMQYNDAEYFSRYSATGISPAVLANRITYTFDLRGPSFTLDTACSSSLYALHSACLALDAFDCDAAVVASANLIQSTEQQLLAIKAGILSPDSICHTFDEAANGYGRAEGVSALYLKRLSDAIRDGDPIRSVIRGTAANGNGKTPGIVQPSIDGQEAVIRAAYRRAGLSTDETDFVEAHGTGTRVGDPIEVEAISRVFRHKTGRPTLVGGIKPSLGHSEAASGLSSIIKVALALENGIIPATTGVKKINPSIRTDEWNVEIVTANRAWPESHVPRASVNSFGFAGANSHAILEAPIAHLPMQTGHSVLSNGFAQHANGEKSHVNGHGPSINHSTLEMNGHISNGDSHVLPVNGLQNGTRTYQDRPNLLILSARSEHSLMQMADRLAAYAAKSHRHLDMRDLAFTLNGHRSRLPIRGFLIAASSPYQNDLDTTKLHMRGAGFSATVPFAFVFTGQGAQWPGMGSELINHYPRFRKTIRYLDSCLQALHPELLPSWTVEATLLASAEESNIHSAEISQPVCTAVQIALTDLLREWGILPQTVFGHSSGEIGAAYAAGILTARQAILTAFCRGQVVANSPSNGAMMAVGLGESGAQTIIADLDLKEHVTVACLNSPLSSTLSGDEVAVEKLLSILQERKVFARKLKTGGKAYHSHHMKALGSKYEELLERVWSLPNGCINGAVSGHTNGDTFCSDKSAVNGCKALPVRMISTVTGQEVTPKQVASPKYWRLNLESPVRFEQAVRVVLASNKCHFIEIGPHSALELPIKQTASVLNKLEDYYLYNSALSRNKDASLTILHLTGSLFLHGHDEINYKQIVTDRTESDSRKPELLVDLPPYPWDYTAGTLGTEPRSVTEFRNRKYPRHDLLGSQLPGGSKLTTTWRNILDVNEVTWLKDHCLGPSIVFPAAAYIAMAVEAMCQIAGLHVHECPGVELRNMNFLKALDLYPEQKPRVEIFFEMRQSQLTSKTVSNRWWHFSVVTISGDNPHPTTHVNGTVGLTEESLSLNRVIRLNKDNMEQHATRVWYEKFRKEGLNFGPQFTIMEEIFCDRARQAREAAATVHLLRGDNMNLQGHPQYIAHPVIFDSMLQAALVATNAGRVRELRATVPVTIDSIQVSAPAMVDMDTVKPWSIDTVSERVGFGTVRIDAELYNLTSQVLIRMSGVRCLAYQGNVQAEAPEQRHPMVRVAWKPDITLLAAGTNASFSKYLNRFAEVCSARCIKADETVIRIGGALDLAVHKQPNARILELGGLDGTTTLMMNILHASSLRRFGTYVKGSFSENGELQGSEITFTGDTDGDAGREVAVMQETKFDILLLCSECKMPISQILDCLTPGAIIIETGDGAQITSSGANYSKTVKESCQGPAAVTMAMLARQSTAKDTTKQPHVILINREGTPLGLDNKIKESLELYFGFQIPVLGLTQLSTATLPNQSVVISTLEADRPLLSTMSEDEMTLVKIITDSASKILWLTNGDLLSGSRPDFAPVLGLSRSLMLEQPSLKFAVFDIDDTSSSFNTTAENVGDIVHQLIHDSLPDFEFAQKEGVVHIVRLDPEEHLNAQFRLKQDEEPIDIPIGGAGRCEMSIKHPGQMDTIRFVKKAWKDALRPDEVEVQVKSVGVNAKDLYALGAKVDTKDATCSCECAGIVTGVGEEVTDLKLGDRVVAMGPGHFATYERFPQWAVLKLNDDENFITSSTIPLVFSTAIYSLKYRANLQPGESVLIHSAAGGVGMAAIQLAKHLGAEIFATVGNESKKNFLVDKFGLDPARIFSSRNSSFLPAILSATSGQGVDVVLNSLTGELLRSSFEACADFGRFIEIGKRDIIDHGGLDMTTFGRDVSFMAFDLSNLYYSKKQVHQKLWQKLLAESMDLIRSGIAKPCLPIEVFDASNVTQAFRHFSIGTRIGKVAVSFQDIESRIKVIPSKHDIVFSPEKSYIMIGCLGGLGRSMSKWMMSRGARNFVFLGRSGLAKPAAKDLVNDLRKQGANVEVVCGDVGKYEDVERAMKSTILPIGGVIQAAMGLSEALWSGMSHESWHTSIGPKLQGTWNLHNALREGGRDAQLDFFVMTSSVSGTIGAATESNYCSANAFLDAFARYRNSLGLPAVSVGLGMISEVGYLHEHPDIEAFMKRKGIHAINEDELLQIMDLALMNQNTSTWKPHYDQLVSSHLLTGIEFIGLKEQRDRGFDGDDHVLADPRASLFAAAFARSTNAGEGIGASAGHGFPEEVAKALREQGGNGGGTSILDAVRMVVAKKMSNLILLPMEKVQLDQKFGEFGLDSMLAAEFRTFIFHALEVDVPFVTLLNKDTSVNSLAQLITEGLQEQGKC